MSAAGGEKVARIPEPWRLQAQLPSGAGDPSRPGAAGAFHCKAFFLRMDVHRRTSLLDVK
jgi:predicted oxidoreductase (fatty acid repression mutant protein)